MSIYGKILFLSRTIFPTLYKRVGSLKIVLCLVFYNKILFSVPSDSFSFVIYFQNLYSSSNKKRKEKSIF